MYGCIKDPVTGNRMYADISFKANVTGDGDIIKMTELMVNDVVPEPKLVDAIVWQLRGMVITDRTLLTYVLNNTFGISTESCPELITAVQDKLNLAMEAV